MDAQVPPIVQRSRLRSRSISGENPSGEAGHGGRAVDGTGVRVAAHLGQGWKISPSIPVPAHVETTLADVQESGVLQHIWLSIPPHWWRRMVLRMYWDGSPEPSVAVPLGDFFSLGWETFAPVNSKYVVSAPYCALNSYWPMPFHERARVTIENMTDDDAILYYYIDYGLGALSQDVMYFHATWCRSNPVRDGIHTILDAAVTGKYVGTYMAVGVNSPGWWGEGEVKFYLDGDTEFPTICGTGTEDYFGGAWDFEVPGHGYTTFSTPYLGLPQVTHPDGLYNSQQRFGMYRWHELDAVNFDSSARVTVQDLGWNPNRTYLVRSDDIASTAFWYAEGPTRSNSQEMSLARMQVSSYPSGSVHS